MSIKIHLRLLLLGTLYFPIIGQSQQTADETVNRIMDQYYFTDPQSGLQHLDSLLKTSSFRENKLSQLILATNKCYLAESMSWIDSLRSYLRYCDELIEENPDLIADSERGQELIAERDYNYGLYYHHTGYYPGAIESFRKSTFDQKGNLLLVDSLLSFDNLCNLANLYLKINEFDVAKDHYVAAERILPKTGYGPSPRAYQYQVAFLQNALGQLAFKKYQVSNDPLELNEAELYFHSAMESLSSEAASKSGVNLFLTINDYLIDIQLARSQVEQAKKTIRKSFSKVAPSDIERKISLHQTAASVYHASHQPYLSTQHLNEALALVDAQYANKHPLRADIYVQMAINAMNSNSLDTALIMCDLAISEGKWIPKDSEDSPSNNVIKGFENKTLKALILKAKLLTNQQRPAEAMTVYRQAASLIDNMRINLDSDISSLWLTKQVTSMYTDAIHLAYLTYRQTNEQEYVEAAFFFMAKSKANVLIQALNDRSARDFAAIPEEILRNEKLLQGKLHFLKEQLLDESDEGVSDQLIIQIIELQRQLQQLNAHLEEDYPAYHEFRFGEPTINLETVQSNLETDKLLIQYHAYATGYYALAITSNGYKLHHIDSVDVDLKLLYQQLTDIESQEAPFNDSLFMLYDLLVAPFSELLTPNTQLLIIPDGVLHQIPFEALLTSPFDGHGEIPFLIRKHAVSYQQSASLIDNIRIQNSLPYTYIGFAPSYSNQTIANKSTLSPLSFNQQEVLAAQQFFNGKAFLDTSATKCNFLNHIGDGSIVHLALHAKVNDQFPSRSALYFEAPGSCVNSVKGNGALFLYELYNQDIQSDLMLLSSCQSGAGETMTGEGIMSLGRAFQYAGSPSVGVTLWEANDRASAYITTRFLNYLSNGASLDHALQHAKLDFLEDPANKYFQHPYYWSGLVLHGQTQPIAFAGTNNSFLLTLGISGLVIATMLYLILKKRSIRGNH